MTPDADSEPWSEDATSLALPQSLSRIRIGGGEANLENPAVGLEPQRHAPPSAWRWAMAGSFLVATYIGGSIGDVVGESGLVWSGGPSLVIGLIAFDALSSLVAMGAVARSIDRLERATLALRVAAVCCVSNLFVALLLSRDRTSPAAFAAVILVERLQFVAMYATALALARDFFGAHVRAQARLRALGTMGAVFGAFLGGAAGTLGVPSWTLFAASSLGFFAAGAALYFGRRVPRDLWERAVPPPPASSTSALLPSLATPLRPEARSLFVRALGRMARELYAGERVRKIAAIGLLNGIAYTTVAYEAACIFDEAGDGGGVQARYGILRAAEPVAAVLCDLFVARWVVQRAGHFRVFGAAPFVFVVGIGGLLVAPSAALILAIAVAVQIAYGLESTGLSAALSPLPAGRRQRVGALLESATYQVGYLVACALFGVVTLARHAGLAPSIASRAWLSAGGTAASLSLVIAVILAVRRRPMRPRHDSLAP